MSDWKQKESFRAYIDRLQLRYFTAEEIAASFRNRRNGAQNEPPEPRLWENCAPTLIALDALRRRIETPIAITSSYRSPAYNAAIGGVSASQHTAFSAVDFTVEERKLSDAAETLLNWQGKRFRSPVPIREGTAQLLSLEPRREADGWSFVFRGGVGYYKESRFLHLDTRGRKAVWQDTPDLTASIAEAARREMRETASSAETADPNGAALLERLVEKAAETLDREDASPAQWKGARGKLQFLIEQLKQKRGEEMEAALERLLPLWPFG